jgi:type IV pilus assembly protein PilM
MLKSKSFLTIDFGAGTLKIAEFEPSEDGGLRLLRFGVKPLGLAGSQDAARENTVKKALSELIAEGGFAGRQANLCAPGFQVFSKFVKLAPVDSSKVPQIMQYEAQQNVPWPLAESAWDYQILSTTPSGELEVLLVGIKSEIVEKLFSMGEGAGLKMDVVDTSVAALCNAFRYNYADQDGCSLLIDVGAKTSNVILLEKNRLYARSVPVGANAITQEFAAEAKLPFAEAEKIKVNDGMVSLGGAYEEPDNPRVAAVSKVARNVLTRLHLQVNQTIQFYRTQQGGNAPVRVFLCGGGSSLPYSAEFFSEKLNLPVDIFNPFRNVNVDPSVDVAGLEKVAQAFGEVVGLGLRNVAQCPVELNLMPKSSKSRQEFNAKKPYLLAAAYALVVGVFAYGWFYDRVEAARREGLEKVTAQVEPLTQRSETLKREMEGLKRAEDETGQMTGWLEDQTFWADVFVELRRILLTAEEAQRQKLNSAPGTVGVWIDTLITTEPTQPVVAQAEETTTTPSNPYGMDPALMKRYGLLPKTATAGEGSGGDAGEGGPKKPKSSNSTNEIATISLTLRAVNLSKIKTGANNELVFEVQNQMKASPFFDANETRFDGTLSEEENTFSFPMKVKLKRPMKLL